LKAAGPFSLWERSLAARYLRAKRRDGGVALISAISFFGVMLAVMVLIIVMSVMNGFRAELLDRILGFNGHLFVQGPVLDGVNRETAAQRIRGVPGVIHVAPLVEAQAMAMGPVQISGAVVRGINPGDLAALKLVSDNLTGSLEGFGEGEDGGNLILVGDRLARNLGVGVGDALSLISPSGPATAFGSTSTQKDYTVGGIFSVGMSQYDETYVYMPLAQAQLFFGRGDSADFIEIKLADPDQAQALKGAVEAAAGRAALVTDWTDRNQAFFGALAVERNVMRLILMLVVAIAALNIISGLVMLVKNKGRDIAILRTIGASQGGIMRIFFMAGASVGVLGAIAGVILGILFCHYITEIQAFVEWATGAAVFSADIYFLSRLPAKIDWSEVGLIAGFSVLVSFLVTLYPSWRASRLDPVEALRYE
jgi:lipoprotein-releasing system permease protein